MEPVKTAKKGVQTLLKNGLFLLNLQLNFFEVFIADRRTCA
jgi:hypothetical protein